MKLVASIVLLFIVGGLAAQVDSVNISRVGTVIVKSDSLVKLIPESQSSISTYDKIKLESGDSIFVTIIAETQTEVAFKYPLNTMINKVPYTKISEIKYKDGTQKAFRNQVPVTGVGAEPDNLWRIVEVTSNESDVAGLKEIGPINAKSEGKTIKTSIELLEKNARVILQKKAVRMSATKVLIKNRNIEQSYGELPVVELEGIAYGKQ